MPDDNIIAPAVGAVLATDLIGGVHHQRAKIQIGDPGSASDVGPDNPLPVGVIALPLAPGAATAAGQDDIVAAVGDIVAATTAFAIVPDDAAALPAVPSSIYVGTSGDVTLRAAGSNIDVVFKAVPAGTILPVRASHVRAAGTTAASLVGLA